MWFREVYCHIENKKKIITILLSCLVEKIENVNFLCGFALQIKSRYVSLVFGSLGRECNAGKHIYRNQSKKLRIYIETYFITRYFEEAIIR